MSYLLGYDIGSSSIKASLLEAATGKVIATATAPHSEMTIQAPQPGWAEQDPQEWWSNVKLATAELKTKSRINPQDITAIGITYQMHGLVIVDQNQQLLRPAIIWCDSRAVAIGAKAFEEIGHQPCLEHLLNSPGNFTASKLKWVQVNEPEIYEKIHRVMLPGEYLAMLMTGEIKTTPSGLSEGIWWDFQTQQPAQLILDHYQISPTLLPEISPVFSVHGELTGQAATQLGLRPGIKVSYIAGDQLNNAFSLKVLHPGEMASTAGTSGVIYGVSDTLSFDPHSRVNTFVHVNHQPVLPRYGILLCLNGAAIIYRWLRDLLTLSLNGTISYNELNNIAASAPVGSDGLRILPYGNGAERTLRNKDCGASLHGLQFNRHENAHLLRAAQEGIVFALNYGLEIMSGMGFEAQLIKAGYANMFLSPIFAQTFATVTGAAIELYNTDGSQGAARGAGVGVGIYQNFEEAFSGLQAIKVVEPNTQLTAVYQDIYHNWLEILNKNI